MPSTYTVTAQASQSISRSISYQVSFKATSCQGCLLKKNVTLVFIEVNLISHDSMSGFDVFICTDICLGQLSPKKQKMPSSYDPQAESDLFSSRYPYQVVLKAPCPFRQSNHSQIHGYFDLPLRTVVEFTQRQTNANETSASSKKRSRQDAEIGDETVREFSFNSKQRKTNSIYNSDRDLQDLKIASNPNTNQENLDPNLELIQVFAKTPQKFTQQKFPGSTNSYDQTQRKGDIPNLQQSQSNFINFQGIIFDQNSTEFHQIQSKFTVQPSPFFKVHLTPRYIESNTRKKQEFSVDHEVQIDVMTEMRQNQAQDFSVINLISYENEEEEKQLVSQNEVSQQESSEPPITILKRASQMVSEQQITKSQKPRDRYQSQFSDFQSQSQQERDSVFADSTFDVPMLKTIMANKDQIDEDRLQQTDFKLVNQFQQLFIKNQKVSQSQQNSSQKGKNNLLNDQNNNEIAPTEQQYLQPNQNNENTRKLSNILSNTFGTPPVDEQNKSCIIEPPHQQMIEPITAN
ncbi:UNKNOWN [Stylonychia lemnae]|uniref:Uncharacterized protein n=1 Tax=Stylonychia lemnae TaxID=5949 RepID=A0A078A1M6_STYLE|nr:UNKNOWN [Stylonychia lemnae]|eukprot:CDW75747.1 UNKNOWN [Stylonychia lemnae]